MGRGQFNLVPLKVLILAGGKGLRLNVSINKCLLKVRGKKLIEYSLDNALSLYTKGLVEQEVIIITGFRASGLKIACGGSYKELTIRYQDQKVATALGAISSARELVNSSFLLMLGDEILVEPNLSDMISVYHSHKCDGILGYCIVPNKERVKQTYSIEVRNGQVWKVVEKPTKVKNLCCGTGNCILPQEFFYWIPPVSSKGIQDFVSCVQYGIDHGSKFLAYPVCRTYFNINTRDDLREASVESVKFG